MAKGRAMGAGLEEPVLEEMQDLAVVELDYFHERRVVFKQLNAKGRLIQVFMNENLYGQAEIGDDDFVIISGAPIPAIGATITFQLI